MDNKIILVGDCGVGKTVFINRHRTGNFQDEYIPTKNTHVSSLTFSTSAGNVVFNIWDISGQDKRTSQDYIGAKGAIIMFDTTSKNSYNNISAWYENVNKLCPNIPVIICGNKVDLKERTVLPRHIIFNQDKNIQYYDISAKSNFNFEKPFLHLIRRFYGKNTYLVENTIQKYVQPSEDDDLSDYEDKNEETEKTAMDIVNDFKKKFSHRKIFTAICKYQMNHEESGYISYAVKNTSMVVFAVDSRFQRLENILSRLEVDKRTIVEVQLCKE